MLPCRLSRGAMCVAWPGPGRWDRHDSCGPQWPSAYLRGESLARSHADAGVRRDPRRSHLCRGLASPHGATFRAWRNETPARRANRRPRPSSLNPCAAVLHTAKRDDRETPPARPCVRVLLHAGRAPGIPRAAKRDACETPRPSQAPHLRWSCPAPLAIGRISPTAPPSRMRRNETQARRGTPSAPYRNGCTAAGTRSVFPHPRQVSPSGDQISLSPPDRSSLSPGGRPATQRSRGQRTRGQRTRDSGNRAAPALPTAVLR
jgi:hypothetical protein